MKEIKAKFPAQVARHLYTPKNVMQKQYERLKKFGFHVEQGFMSDKSGAWIEIFRGKGKKCFCTLSYTHDGKNLTDLCLSKNGIDVLNMVSIEVSKIKIANWK